MHLLLVKFHSGLEHDEVLELMNDRLELFRAVPGLEQKYYAREESTGDYVGVYIFVSREALISYRESQLAASIPGVYKVEGAPRREVAELIFALRPDTI